MQNVLPPKGLFFPIREKKKEGKSRITHKNMKHFPTLWIKSYSIYKDMSVNICSYILVQKY